MPTFMLILTMSQLNKYAFEIGNVEKKLILILKNDLSF